MVLLHVANVAAVVAVRTFVGVANAPRHQRCHSRRLNAFEAEARCSVPEMYAPSGTAEPEPFAQLHHAGERNCNQTEHAPEY